MKRKARLVLLGLAAPALLACTCSLPRAPLAAAGVAAAAPAAAGFARFAGAVRGWQDGMIEKAKQADPSASWTVDEHSRGRAVIIEDGDVWEKGCISVTLIEDSELTATRAKAISARTGTGIEEGDRYSACALSFVLHARSPMVPTLRGDVRVFAVGGEEWYGGGLDLTPTYVEEADCRHFHAHLAQLCESHGGPETYAAMKKTCDEYFFIPARGEHRGVGGVFFDDLEEPWAQGFAEALIQCALANDGPYMPIVEQRQPLEYTEAQKKWQLLRRGRYIEFNLLYDRGVKFGLNAESVERVLVSSPPLVAFKYKAIPEPGTPEAETLEVLRNPREWV